MISADQTMLTGLSCGEILSYNLINDTVADAYHSFNTSSNSSGEAYPSGSAVAHEVSTMWSGVCSNSTFVGLYEKWVGPAHPANFSYQEAFSRAAGITVVSFVVDWSSACLPGPNRTYGACNNEESWTGWLENDTVTGPSLSQSPAFTNGPAAVVAAWGAAGYSVDPVPYIVGGSVVVGFVIAYGIIRHGRANRLHGSAGVVKGETAGLERTRTSDEAVPAQATSGVPPDNDPLHDKV